MAVSYRQDYQYNLNQEEEEKSMSQYLTPLKENISGIQNQTKTHLTPRQGDWVCYNCNNLNFSFRKKCNRCKVQSRQENQRILNYYQTLPQHYFYQEQKENFPSIYNHNSKHCHSPVKTTTKVPNATAATIKEGMSPHRERAELPSVSPLVKKYNNSEARSSQESKRGGLFENESMWANINLNYLQQPRSLPVDDDDLDEMEKIIERIMF